MTYSVNIKLNDLLSSHISAITCYMCMWEPVFIDVCVLVEEKATVSGKAYKRISTYSKQVKCS